mgnify:CR=1 FL=1
MKKLTKAQQQACAWLLEHNGEGVWAKNGTLLAAGEVAPVMRRTWNTLRDRGLVLFKDRRMALTEAGRAVGACHVYDGFPTQELG